MILNMNGGGSGGVSADGGVVRTMTVTSGCHVKKGDFIQFDEGYWGSATNASSVTNSGQYCCAVEIDESRILVISTRSQKMYGSIYSISGTSMTFVSETQLASGMYYEGQCIKLQDGKFFLAYNIEPNLHGVLFSIDGTNFTIHKDVVIATNTVSDGMGTDCCICRIIEHTKNNISILYNGYISSDKTYTPYKYILVVSVNGNDVTSLASKQVSTNYSEGYPSGGGDMTLYAENKLLINYIDHIDQSGNTGSYAYSYVRFCTINGSTITLGTSSYVSNGSRSVIVAQPTIMNKNCIYVPYCSSDSNSSYDRELYVFYTDGSTLTKYSTSARIGLNDSYGGWEYKDFIKCKNDTLYFFEQVNNHIECYNVTSVVGKNVRIASSAQYFDALLMTNGKIVVVYSGTSSNSYKLGYVIKSTPTISKSIFGNHCGIALSDGSGGDTIEVLIPN